MNKKFFKVFALSRQTSCRESLLHPILCRLKYLLHPETSPSELGLNIFVVLKVTALQTPYSLYIFKSINRVDIIWQLATIWTTVAFVQVWPKIPPSILDKDWWNTGFTRAEKKRIWLFETRAAPEKAAAEQKDVYLENEAEEVQTLFFCFFWVFVKCRSRKRLNN